MATRLFPLLVAIVILAGCEDQTGPGSSLPPPPPQAGSAAVTVLVHAESLGAEIPADFLGLGFETPVMRDAHLQGDATLEQLLRNLGPGTLRFGGNSVQHTVWRPGGLGKLSFFQLTPADVDATLGFARRIGWRLAVAIALDPADPSTAAEAEYLLQRGRDVLLAVEPGNEPNLYPLNGIRSPGYTVDSFMTEFDTEAAGFAGAAPGIPIAGPSTWCTGGGAWFSEFLSQTKTPLAYTTHHFYPMGVPAPAGSAEAATVENMLSPALMARTKSCVDSAVVAASAHGLAVRVDETNSAFGFGKPGVSDVFASALWGLDHLYTLAELGVAGVNLQTGTSVNGGLTCKGIYLPICDDGGRWITRPLYYAMLLFHVGAVGRAAPVEIESTPAANVVAHATVADDGSAHILVINKEDALAANLTLQLGNSAATSPATVTRLVGPSLLAQEGVTLGGSAVGAGGTWSPATPEPVPAGEGGYLLTVPPGSAALVVVP